MHEYSITCSIISILEKTAANKKISKIKKVNFELSPLASIEPESIRFYFEFLTRENVILKSAKLNFRKLKYKCRCTNCSTVFSAEDFISKCPACGVTVLSGNKLDDISDDIKIISILTD
jgi:hydrogenase nickel incorporation protein HypA/HybF